MVPLAATKGAPARATARSIARALLALAVALFALSAPTALAASARHNARRAINTKTIFHSRLLWATIDVCNPADQPDTVGIRGSMPGDGQAHDITYMSFRLQYMNSTTKVWTDLAKGAASDYVRVGSGGASRQAGRSFQLSPVAGQPAFSLRAVVSFQWRHGKTVLAQTSRTTSSGRDSLAGSDPAGFSAATCMIG